VHVEIDTGMSRQGVQPSHLAGLLERLGAGSPLWVEGVMTHFDSAEERELTREQMNIFAAALDTVAACGIRPEIVSAGSSASALEQDTDAVTDMAVRLGARRMLRTGIALYGYAPGGAQEMDLQAVLAWKTRVVSLREIEVGATAGYDATFTARRRTRLALLPVGYADGLNRRLSNRGWVLVRGQRAPVAGRISMDQTMVDVTDIPGVAIGDEAVLMGEQGDDRVTAGDMAQLTGTICYEVLCGIADRVPRMMVD
jgi:alanine racemase